jgi:hypothetical protein
MEKKYSGSRAGKTVDDKSSEKSGIGWVLVFDSSSVRKANHGRGRNGISH